MGRPRKATALIEAEGRTHLTKAEKEERKARESSGLPNNIKPPEFLLKKQREMFVYYAKMLVRIGMTELDADCLTRYVLAQEIFVSTSKRIARDPEKASHALQLQQDRAFRQAHQSAQDLGMTLTSRCKLDIPDSVKEDDEL